MSPTAAACAQLAFLAALSAGCQTTAVPAHHVYEAEALILLRAKTDLGCTGRIHVTTVGTADRYKAEGCGREAAYLVTCAMDADAEGACQRVLRL